MKGVILWRMVVLWLVAASSVAADSANFTHDANGNLTSRTEGGVEWAYAYDSRDQLREVRRDGTIIEVYQYDAQGRRVRKTGADGIVRYVWDGDRIVEETDDFGNPIAEYTYAGNRLLSVRHVTEGLAFYLVDSLGSPVALVRPDGTIAARYQLDAWGVLRSEDGASTNPFLFTGHLFDAAAGLYYAKARYYDPTTGRFLSEDPLEGMPLEPMSLHPYLYAMGNPTVYVDPDGRCVSSLQQKKFCQAITEWMVERMVGGREADVAREIAIREKVVHGRRQFRQEFGRQPLPDEVVWSDERRALTSGFEEIDKSGRAEATHPEWALIGAGVGTRIAVSAARAAGATAAEQALAVATSLGDEALGELVGVSPGDVATVGRLAKQDLAARPPPTSPLDGGARIVGESATGPTAQLTPVAHQGARYGDSLHSVPTPSTHHKADRWREYQARGGSWTYERWSSVYDQNVGRALRANAAVAAYHQNLGWGRREVTVDVEGIPRRIDIADAASLRGRELKSGAQFATQENLWEIERDRILREKGWDIRWHFEGTASEPLRQALEQAGIPFTGGVQP